jgi:hypothetical protein
LSGALEGKWKNASNVLDLKSFRRNVKMFVKTLCKASVTESLCTRFQVGMKCKKLQMEESIEETMKDKN